MNDPRHFGFVIVGSRWEIVDLTFDRSRSSIAFAAGTFTLVVLTTGRATGGVGCKGVWSGPRLSLLRAMQKFS